MPPDDEPLSGELTTSCTECRARVAARIKSHQETWLGDPEFPSQARERLRYYFCVCTSCSSVLVLLSEYIGYWDEPVRVYPARADVRDRRIPDEVRRSLNEGVATMQHQFHTSAVLMCRRTLEAVCADRNAPGSNLAQKLAGLHAQGDIDLRLKEWADALRLSGNKTTHDISRRFGEEETRDIVDFTRALVDYVYVLSARFEEFMKRRAAAATP